MRSCHRDSGAVPVLRALLSVFPFCFLISMSSAQTSFLIGLLSDLSQTSQTQCVQSELPFLLPPAFAVSGGQLHISSCPCQPCEGIPELLSPLTMHSHH